MKILAISLIALMLVTLMTVPALASIYVSGDGSLIAKGNGKATISAEEGTITFHGKGIVRIKGTDDIDVKGFGFKYKDGEYKVYEGKGSITATGENIEMVVRGKGKLSAAGTGAVFLRGDGSWKAWS